MDALNNYDLKEVGRRAAEKAEKELIRKTLLVTCWNCKRAARLLEVSYNTLLVKAKRYRLDRASAALER